MLRSLMCPSGPEQAVADADLAMAEEPPWSPWRGQALGMAGQAYLLAGDKDTARTLLEELVASSASATNADAYVIALAELAVLAMDRGQMGRVGGPRPARAGHHRRAPHGRLPDQRARLRRGRTRSRSTKATSTAPTSS